MALLDTRPPSEGYRAISSAPVMRDADGEPPHLIGHFARFGVFNEIDSVVEGRFLEKIERGAFKKTFAENRPKHLFQHGKDPQVGDKPIASPGILREDEIGPFYDDVLLEGVPPLVVAGLRAGQYGVSYRFSVVREDWDPKPGKSDVNPHGLPERTIREAKVYEYGEVTFPADAGTSVMVRSLSDEMSRGGPVGPGQSYRVGEPDGDLFIPTTSGTITIPTPSVTVSEAPSLDAEALPHLEPERRDEPVTVAAIQRKEPQVPPDISIYPTRDEKVARVGDIEREMEALDGQFDGVLPDEPQARWDEFVEEKKILLAAIDAVDRRRAELGQQAVRDNVIVPGQYTAPNIVKQRDLSSIYDVRRIEREARSEPERVTHLRDSAMRAVEGAQFTGTDRAKGQGEIEALLRGIDTPSTINSYVDQTEVAKRVLYTGSPAYRRAYRKWLTQSAAGPMFTAEEANAFEEARTALVTASNTAVVFDLDPTMVINTSGAINPFRQAFRVVKTTSNDWRPSVSSGMTAVYEDEATAATDLSPAFTAPARLLVKAHTAATFSVEIQGDYSLAGGLEAELAREIADAKDVLEATQFSTGAGTTHFPNGIYTYFTANFLDTTTTLVIVPADLYKLEANLGPRYRGNSVWLGSPYFYSLVRGIDTAGGAGLWVDNLTLGGSSGNFDNNGRLGNLIGHPAYEAIAPANSSMATTEKVAILANRDRFVIIDRIGMNLELIPNVLDATTGFPTGQRMVYAWWRNTSTGIGLATLGAGRAACIFRGK